MLLLPMVHRSMVADDDDAVGCWLMMVDDLSPMDYRQYPNWTMMMNQIVVVVVW
jgi:hypothetical protein